MRKQLMSMFLVLCMVFTLLPGTVTGAAILYPVEIDGTFYASLDDAVIDVKEGQTIRLLKDITLVSSFSTGSNDNSFTLDLNGKRLDGGKYYIAIWHTGAGKLTIKDRVGGGLITGTYSSTIYVHGGSLEVTGGTIQNTGSGTDYSTILNKGTGSVTISGGKVQLNTYGSAINNISDGSIFVTGGVVEAKDTSSFSHAIYNQTGMVSVTGGTVSSSKGMAIYQDGKGKIFISGENTLITSGTSGNGTICLVNGNSENTPLKITGGTVENTATGGTAIYASGGKVYIPNGSSVIKSAGKVMNVAPDLSGYTDVQITANKNAADAAGASLIGKEDIDSAEEIQAYKYLKFEAATVSDKVAVNRTTNTEYPNLQAAIDGVAEDGQVIQLLEDINLTAPLTVDADVSNSFTLDLNGKKLNGGDNIVMNYNSTNTLTIIDSAEEGGLITSAFGSTSKGIININSGSIIVASGTVENTGVAIYIDKKGSFTVSGGTVQSTGTSGRAINNSYGSVTVTGGTVQATGTSGYVIYSNYGSIRITDGTLQSASSVPTIYAVYMSELSISKGLVKIPEVHQPLHIIQLQATSG